MSADKEKKNAGDDPAEPTVVKSDEKDCTVSVLVYRQLQRAAKKVAEPLTKLPEVKKIILSTDAQISEKLQNYGTMLHYLKSLNASCDDVITSLAPRSIEIQEESKEKEKGKGKEPEAKVKPFANVQATLTAVETMLKAISDLFALFSVEEEYTPSEFELDSDTIVTTVGGAFITAGEPTVELYPASRLTSSDGEFLNQVAQLKTHLAQLKLAETKSDEGKALITNIEELQTLLSKDKGSALSAFLKNEKIVEMLANRDAALLTINIPFSGGERVVVKNRFFRQNKIEIAGGVVISYMLSTQNGRILSSGLVESFSGYKPYRDIKMSDLKTVSPSAIE